MTFAEILASLYRKFDYASSPSATVVTRMKAEVNEAYRELMSLPGLEFVRQDVQPITALANVARTGLPPNVARVLNITDRTNFCKLQQVPLRELRITDPSQSFAGSFPTRYAVIGNQAVQRQPDTSGLWVASSAAADTTQHAFLESVTTGGYPNAPLPTGTTLTGTTRAAVGALTSHIEVTKFYIDAAATGSVSLYDAAVAGNELARIPIGLTNSRYSAIEWWPIQSADTTEYLDYERQIYDLVNNTDEPLLPVDFHWLVDVGARVREYEVLDDNRLSSARSEYESGKLALKAYVLNNGDRIASLRYERPTRLSSLGSMFPAGT